MQILYNIFFILFAIASLPSFLLRKKGHKDFLQRFGVFDRALINGIADNGPIWVHAVSVGEIKTAEGLIARIRAMFPSKRIVISNVTAAGREIALSIAAEGDAVIYLPLDLSFIARKVIKLIRPSVFIIIETEIWPNLITELCAAKVPVALMNGRISPKSFRNYKAIKPVMRRILEKIAVFAMRTKDDAQRIIELGAPRERVTVTGNMKFDIVCNPPHGQAAPDAGRAQRLPVERKSLWLGDEDKLVIAGSTHRGEDAKILKAYKAVKNDLTALRLLIAPRHMERVNEVSALAVKFGFRPVKISEIDSVGALNAGTNCVFILDSIGYLKPLYQLAAVVFMGGSLVPHGGHNFVEPAAYAKPIITGPFVHNFKDMAELFIREDAIRMVRSEDELERSLRELLFDDARRRALGENARKVVLGNVGSTDRNCLLMMDLVYHERI